MVIQPPIFSKELSTTTSELQHLFQQVRSYSLKPGENPTPFPPLTLWYFTGRDVQMPQERELFLQSVTGVQQAGDIYRINSWIKENFRESFTVEDLAGQQNMGVSLFYQRFKSAVGMGPLQCQKRLRLTEARRLMLDEGKNVTQAAMDVRYESIPQFNREYRRMYGLPPKEDILSLCRRLEH